MSKPRVTISNDDLFCYRLLDSVETIDMFGEDYLLDYGVDIPPELLKEYKEVMVLYNQLQDKLRVIYNK